MQTEVWVLGNEQGQGGGGSGGSTGGGGSGQGTGQGGPSTGSNPIGVEVITKGGGSKGTEKR